MRLDIAAQSDIGRRKSKNEDSYGIFLENTAGLRLFEEGALLCVADGLGGHIGGDIASKLAVSIVRDMLNEDPFPMPNGESNVDERDEGPLPLLRATIQKANDSIHQTNRDLLQREDASSKSRPMGTTVLSALIQPRRVYIANVGDSRAYHIRDNEIIARTEDHSWVDEQVKAGLIS